MPVLYDITDNTSIMNVRLNVPGIWEPECEWSTLEFGLTLEKRLQTVTFNPAVFRADILASMFDIFMHKENL